MLKYHAYVLNSVGYPEDMGYHETYDKALERATAYNKRSHGKRADTYRVVICHIEDNGDERKVSK